MHGSSHRLETLSEQMQQRSVSVESDSTHLSKNITGMTAMAGDLSVSAHAVAASVKEMSASIREVSQNCARESSIAKEANQQALATRDLTQQFTKRAHEIEKIAELIDAIARQTNLLALNATIEAASAGDAGKGFAVVASEVKGLARETAKATEHIHSQIQAIQKGAEDSLHKIEQMVALIEEVNNISTSIASAVEEQSSTSSEIAKNMGSVSQTTQTIMIQIQESAGDAASVSGKIKDLNNAATEVSVHATQNTASSSEITLMAQSLKEAASRFKI